MVGGSCQNKRKRNKEKENTFEVTEVFPCEFLAESDSFQTLFKFVSTILLIVITFPQPILRY